MKPSPRNSALLLIGAIALGAGALLWPSPEGTFDPASPAQGGPSAASASDPSASLGSSLAPGSEAPSPSLPPSPDEATPASSSAQTSGRATAADSAEQTRASSEGATPSLEGQVHVGGEPLEGAQVTWVGEESGVTSDSRGLFSLPWTRTVATLLVTGPPGYERKLVTAGRRPLLIELEPSQETPRDLRCQVLDPAGRGVQAVVSVQFLPDGSFVSLETSPSGEIVIPAPSGVRGGTCGASGDSCEASRDFSSEDLASVIELRLRPLSSILVQAEDAAGAPLAGCALSCGGTSGPTDASGRRRLDGLKPGSYSLVLSSPRGLPAARTEVKLAEGETRSIVLRASNTEAQLALFHPQGQAAPRSPLYLAPIAEPLQGALVQSDANGWIRLQGVAPGTYGAWLSRNSAGAGERALVAKFEIPTRSPKRVEIPRQTALRGRVVLEDGTPLPGLQLRFDRSRWYVGASAETDAKGSFDLGPFPQGALRAKIRSRTYVRVTHGPKGALELGDEPLEIVARRSRTLIVTGQLSPTVRARVATGELIVCAWFSAKDEAPRSSAERVAVGESFEAHLEGLTSHSSARVVVYATGCAPQSFTCSEFAEEQPRLDLGIVDLAPGARLKARFRLEGLEDRDQIVVNVRDPVTRWEQAESADLRGVWLGTGLPRAELRLMAWANRPEGRWVMKRSLSLEELLSGDLGEIVIPRER